MSRPNPNSLPLRGPPPGSRAPRGSLGGSRDPRPPPLSHTSQASSHSTRPPPSSQGAAPQAPPSARAPAIYLDEEEDNDQERPQTTEISKRDPKYGIVRDIVMVTLDIMKTPRARASLQRVGDAVVAHWGANVALFDPRHDDMLEWVDTFLSKLTRNFVDVTLRTNMRAIGQFQRVTWFNPESRRHPLDAWKPEKAGRMFLHAFGVETMTELDEGRTARHQTAYDTLLVSAALVVAHELAHCFVGMLAASGGASTPVQVTVGSWAAGPNHGESGWTFEYYLCGGIPRNFRIPDDPLDFGQGGELWIEDQAGNARRVDPECIGKIAAGGPDLKDQFPLKKVRPVVRADQLERDRWVLSQLWRFTVQARRNLHSRRSEDPRRSGHHNGNVTRGPTRGPFAGPPRHR